MSIKKLNTADIVAFVQYEAGLNDYFKLNDTRANEIKALISSNDSYKKEYNDIKDSLNLAISEPPSNSWKIISIAATILFSIIAIYLFRHTDSSAIISINDFNLQMIRGENDLENSTNNKLIYQLHEGHYSIVINRLEKDSITIPKRIYITALILEGQKSKQLMLLEKAKKIISQSNNLVSEDLEDKLIILIESLKEK